MTHLAFKRAAIALMGSAAMLGACSSNDNTTTTGTTKFVETKLVADDALLGAATVDANLVNPWGLAFGPTGILWVANNHTGTSTLYDASGAVQSLVVTIPTTGAATGGAPTGEVFNGTADFLIPSSTAALFIFAGEDGIISGWNSGTAAVVLADRSANDAVYKGLAMGVNGSANFLYATNFKNNLVDVFSSTFQVSSSFTDPNIPAGFAPFGIQNIGGLLYVTFAKQKGPDNEDDQAGVGNGYVDIFNPNGTLVKRFASTGNLNSPWGVALAPSGFGKYAGDILIGNFGDGKIGVYNPTTGDFIAFLQDANGNTITIDGLWALTFGPGANSTTLYFSAGPDEESHGLLGTIKPM